MQSLTRRQLLTSSMAIAGTGILGEVVGRAKSAADPVPRFKSERISFAGIGLRYQGSVDLHTAAMYGDVTAVCDVDRHVVDQACASFGSRPRKFSDYRKLLEQKDIDAVVIGTPDHWHTKIAADALRSGKHVYVEKPLTLTVDEGKFLCKVALESGRVLQVGSWQRSDSRFRLAVEMVRNGRIGKLNRVEVVLGKNKTGGPFTPRLIPGHLDWNQWQGQTPDTPYVEQRCHYTFRWWQEYSGGQMTDWGAHHLDIAQWAIGALPIGVTGKARYPTKTRDGYNVPIDFEVNYAYPGGVTMTVADNGRNGILFQGDRGRLFVNRGTVAGKPVDDLKINPLDRKDFQLYDFDNFERVERAGKLDAIVNHMGNFVDCIAESRSPISDVVSQHQSVTTCHIGNIALQLGRELKWDSSNELFMNDAEANRLLTREQREGFEVV